MSTLRIVMAQLDLKVAGIRNNQNNIIEAIKEAKTKLNADLIVFPELTITGYPPEDLLLRDDLYPAVDDALKNIIEYADGIDVILGYPKKVEDKIYNVGAWIRDQHIITEHYKQELPNFGVFDEKRYFTAGIESNIVSMKNIKIGLLVCEDVWHPGPMTQTKDAGAEFIISINASPYTMQKMQRRYEMFEDRAAETGLPHMWINNVAGQDDLLFDGSSSVVDKTGKVTFQSPAFVEDLFLVEIDTETLEVQNPYITQQSEEIVIYRGLVTGVRDYVNKNGFPGALIGLSGGIDSALTLAIAVDALGKDRVRAVMMPSPYTSQASLEDAKAEAELLGVDYQVIPIQPLFESFESALHPLFQDTEKDKTEENLQARIRGTLLMALSNKFGKLVLTTGNKSEIAVGYMTLYGDMAGGFCVLKDVYKTMVYKLAEYRNSLDQVIPERVITRPPSAELAPDQTDQDSLPPYEVLDQIIDAFAEGDESIDSIVAKGFDEATVRQVARMILFNEYKRRQAPPGPRLTQRSFDHRNRRYPITSGFIDLIK